MARKEVGAGVVVAVMQDLRSRVFGRDVQPFLHDDRPAHLGGELLEGLAVFFHGAVDIEVVGVHRGDDGDGRMQLQEGTVVLVGLRNHRPDVAHDQVRTVVLGDSAQEGRAAFPAVREDVCEQGAGGRLPVRSGNGEEGLSLGQFAQHPRPLDEGVPLLADVDHFAQVIGNGRRVDDQRGGDIFRDGIRVVRVVDVDAFALQGPRQVGWCAVIPGDAVSLELVIAGDGAHADAADPQEVYFRVFRHVPIKPICRFRPR